MPVEVGRVPHVRAVGARCVVGSIARVVGHPLVAVVVRGGREGKGRGGRGKRRRSKPA